MLVISSIGLIVAVVLLIYLVFKGYEPIYILIPIVAILAITSGLSFKDSWMTTMMESASNMFTSLAPLLTCSLMFSGLFGLSGASKKFAETVLDFGEKIFRAKPGNETIVGIRITVVFMMLIEGVFNFFGLDGLAVSIVMFPIGVQMLKKYNLNRKVLPALLYCSSTLACLPFAVNNTMVIHSQTLGVSTGSHAVIGFIGCACGAAFNIIFLTRYMKKNQSLGGFVPGPQDSEVPNEVKLPPFILTVIPLVISFILFTFVGLKMPVALLCAIILELIFYSPQFRQLAKIKNIKAVTLVRENLNQQVKFAVYLVATVALLVGYSSVIQQTPAFGALISALTSGDAAGMYWKCGIAMAIVIAISANTFAGMLTNLNIVAPYFLQVGVPAHVIMRLSSTATLILDTLPTNIGIITAHNLSGVKMKDGYYACFMVTCVGPAISFLINLILLGFAS